MAAYTMVHVDVHDDEMYAKYAKLATEAAEEFGGEFLVRGGKYQVMEGECKPRNVILRFKDFDTAAAVHDRIRKTYDGPLSLAEDFMVWNVTKDDLKVRMAVTEEHTWSPPLARPAVPPDPKDKGKYAEMKNMDAKALEFSDFTKSGYLDVDDVLRPIYEEAGEKMGREFPYPGDK